MGGAVSERVRKLLGATRFLISWNLMSWGSRMMSLGSEGVYLNEKGCTNASRHLLGPNPSVKNLKNVDVGVSGASGDSYKTPP